MDFATLMDSQSGIVALGMAAVSGVCAFICAFMPAPTELDRLQQGQSQKRRRRGQWRQVMHGRPSSASFNWFLKVFGNTAAVPVWALCALTAALHGCGSSGALTSVPPAPMTPGAIITEAWAYEEGGRWEQVEGEWIHLPANEGAELLLWIEHAEELCR